MLGPCNDGELNTDWSFCGNASELALKVHLKPRPSVQTTCLELRSRCSNIIETASFAGSYLINLELRQSSSRNQKPNYFLPCPTMCQGVLPQDEVLEEPPTARPEESSPAAGGPQGRPQGNEGTLPPTDFSLR
jgi:hypothetical protein